MKINFSQLFKSDLSKFSVFFITGPSQTTQMRALKYIETQLKLTGKHTDLKSVLSNKSVQPSLFHEQQTDLIIINHSAKVDLAQFDLQNSKLIIIADKYTASSTFFKNSVKLQNCLVIPSFEEHISEDEFQHIIKGLTIDDDTKNRLKTIKNDPLLVYQILNLIKLSLAANANEKDLKGLFDDVLIKSEDRDIIQNVRYKIRKNSRSYSLNFDTLKNLCRMEKLAKISPNLADAYSLFYVEQ